MLRAVFLFLILLGFSPALRAQAPERAAGGVTGAIVDSATGKPLREASVALLAGRDSSYVTFSITDGDGRFALKRVAPGAYQLLITYLGYASQRVAVRVPAHGPGSTAPPSVAVGTVQLVALSQKLGEVVIEQERAPVSVSGDTLAFSARAFKTAPNAPVEALLKKLPGVEVDRNGTIRAQGQTVNRVLVDGKPFFGDDPKIATRNLPADIVDQVQMFDQRSDQAAFSGMDDGNRQRTINLTIKRDKRKGYFGTNSLGGGAKDLRHTADGRYRGQLGLNRFNNGRQLSALGMANNINQQGFGEGGGLPSPDGNFGSGGGPGAGLFGGSFGGSDGPGNGPMLVMGGQDGRSLPTTITESAAAGLNYRDALGHHAEIATSYLATRATVTSDQQRRRENIATSSSLTGETGATLVADQTALARTRTTGHRFSLRLDYVLDSLTSLRVTPNLLWQTVAPDRSTQQQVAAGTRPLSQSQTRYDGSTSTLAGIGNLLLMRKFRREGRTFSATLSSVLNRQDGTAFNRTTNTFFDSTGTGVNRPFNQRIGLDGLVNTHTLSVAYVEPLSLTRKLEAHASLTDSRTRAERAVANYDEPAGQYGEEVAGLSNRFHDTWQARRAGLLLQTRRLRFGYGLGLDAQQADLRVTNQTADTALTRRFTTLLPTASLTWNGPRGRVLRLNYRTRLAPPSASQLQPVVDNTDPLRVQVGNPGLRPEFQHQLTATYQHFDMATTRNVFGLLTASAVQDRITQATSFNAMGGQLIRPVNTDGYRALTGFLSVGQRLNWHKLNASLNTAVTRTRGQSFVNDAPSVARTWQVSPGVSLHTSFDEKLDVDLGVNLTWQQARYSLQAQQNTTFWTRTLTADVYYQLPGRLVLTSDLWLVANTGRAAGYNQPVTLWTAGLARQFFRNRQGELKLQVFDLLNQNRGIERNVTDTYVEDLRSRVLTRYWLLSFTYNLRAFGV